MRKRGRTLRFTAVSALVVLSLTGFTAGRHGGHGGGHDGGGGCSSGSQDHDGSSSSGGGAYKEDDDDDGTGGYGGNGYGNGNGYGADRDDDDRGGGSGGGNSGLSPATVELVSCASDEDPYATVEVTNPNGGERTFTVTVLFRNAGDTTIQEVSGEATVPAGEVATVRLEFDAAIATPGERPDHCEIEDSRPLPEA
ncbi:hypothetical protein [Streptomyces sp. SHP 1-2]|uniref:hypothetical protein n=1 Tax=Streptomyces sp. SHP 1-2 TaxID=2769489 RepID=UPI00223778F5|nr:hypothetical protein [Streptomyces sp. SHP 1-2]MCW5250881.1 hypothetical protein [Streptomyces sp. SHP 1-2]